MIPLVLDRLLSTRVNREDDGGYRVTAAISNIGGMDSGPVTVQLIADGSLLKTVRLDRVLAGNNRKENPGDRGLTMDAKGGAT